MGTVTWLRLKYIIIEFESAVPVAEGMIHLHRVRTGQPMSRCNLELSEELPADFSSWSSLVVAWLYRCKSRSKCLLCSWPQPDYVGVISLYLLTLFPLLHIRVPHGPRKGAHLGVMLGDAQTCLWSMFSTLFSRRQQWCGLWLQLL